MTVASGWTEQNGKLSKNFAFPSFRDAIAFMMRVSFECEAADHHPEWKNVYKTLYVELTTHDAGGVTSKDHALAGRMDELYAKTDRSL
jgi:4a-hydroxytetrahydrobiopterin dehydratase